MKVDAVQLMGAGILDPAMNQIPRGAKTDSPEAIREVARQFESVFLHQVFKTMRQTLPKDGMLSAGFGGEVFTDMLDQQYADQASATGSLGLANLIALDLGAEEQELPGATPKGDLAALRRGLGMRAFGANAAQLRGPTSQGFAMPVVGRVSSPYGMRQLDHEDEPRLHEGIDFAAPEGTPIRAARDGVVEFAGVRGGYGNTVVVDHGDGTKSLYAHASVLNVREGQRVRKGAEIAQVGSTGHSTGPHLHFEVRRNGEAVDPTSLLRQ